MNTEHENDWQPWSLKLNLPQGLYWFRLPEAGYGGVVCRPEFVHEITSMRNGVVDKNFNLPAFAHWTGYHHTIPENLEVKQAQKGELLEAKRIVIPGFPVLDCPFCGSSAELKSSDQEHGCARLYSYPLKPNIFWVSCTQCWAKTPEFVAIKSLVELWNTRSGKEGV